MRCLVIGYRYHCTNHRQEKCKRNVLVFVCFSFFWAFEALPFEHVSRKICMNSKQHSFNLISNILSKPNTKQSELCAAISLAWEHSTRVTDICSLQLHNITVFCVFACASSVQFPVRILSVRKTHTGIDCLFFQKFGLYEKRRMQIRNPKMGGSVDWQTGCEFDWNSSQTVNHRKIVQTDWINSSISGQS